MLQGDAANPTIAARPEEARSDDGGRPAGTGAHGLPKPVRGDDPCGLRGVGGDVRLPRPLQRGSPRLRGGPVLVPGRAARSGASLPVRCHGARLRRCGSEPGECPPVRRPALAWDRVPDPQRLPVRQRQLGHRRGGDRPARGAVRPARQLLLRALGRALRAVARQGRGSDLGARGARGAGAARGRG